MAFKKGDFIKIEFTAKTADGDIFDSNIKEDLEKSKSQGKAKPLILCLGERMFLKGVEDFLIGKEKGKYKIELSAENAFGKRDTKLIQTMHPKVFSEHNLRAVPGFMFNFDGRIGKVIAVSGGRVIVDFNNPIAGKDVVYDVNVLEKIDDVNEKVKALNDFFFRREFDFEIKDKKLIMKVEKQLVNFVEMFKEKYKDILGLELDVKEIEMPVNDTKEK